MILGNMGCALVAQGDLADATGPLTESLQACKELNSREHAAPCVAGFAAAAFLGGEAVRAARLWGAADGLNAAIGTPRQPQTFPLYEDFYAATEQALGSEAFRHEAQAGRQLGFDEVIELALRGSAD